MEKDDKYFLIVIFTCHLFLLILLGILIKTGVI